MNEKGADNSKEVELWEAYYAGAEHRLRVNVKGDGLLTLKGAKHLARRLESVIRRLEKKKPPKKPVGTEIKW